MHRWIGAVPHGVIDYLMVIILAVGPGVAGFQGRQAALCYMLAAIHFGLTILTRFPLGILKHVGFPVHGAIEFIIGLLMIVLPWVASFARGVLSRNFFMAIGALILLIWFLTDYRGLRGTTTG
ncbi:MAG: hypothetical protein ACXVH7_13770 [Thermoanaerobaculia bacterium]